MFTGWSTTFEMLTIQKRLSWTHPRDLELANESANSSRKRTSYITIAIDQLNILKPALRGWLALVFQSALFISLGKLVLFTFCHSRNLKFDS